MNRQARLFAIAEHLRGRRTGVTAEALAERFGVTVRTMYRDLDALRDAHLPLQAERGRGGGYALDRAYTLPPVNFSPREAAILLTLGRYAEELRLLPFVETLTSACDKVRAALSASAQRELIDLMAGLHFVGVPAPAISPAVRAAVERAWFEQCVLRVRYRDRDHVTSERRLRLRGITFDRATVRLACDDLDSGEARVFMTDRVEQASVEPCQVLIDRSPRS
jgi:predicted DNA-binding transcriptional regulator YafY